MVIFKIFLLILLTDLITGAFHWWEDRYGNPNWKWLGEAIVIPNLEHHQSPRKFLLGSFLERTGLSIIFSTITMFVFYFFDVLTWEVRFVLIYGSMANELHAMAHRTDKENGRLITLIQKTGLIQSRGMHGYHHQAPFDCNYCILTNYLNPVLNYIKFWTWLEKVISLFGINPIKKN